LIDLDGYQTVPFISFLRIEEELKQIKNKILNNKISTKSSPTGSSILRINAKIFWTLKRNISRSFRAA
jgi:hypothetical protein